MKSDCTSEVPEKSSVAAVVVTYNRLALLQECVAALRCQTRRVDEIIIVNNSSTDGTAAWLTSQPDLTIITQPNSGSAGGQYTGANFAYLKGHDWFWLMDDDGLPLPDSLERLVEQDDGRVNWLNCLVVDKMDVTRLTFGLLYEGRLVTSVEEATRLAAKIRYANPFNGSLLHRRLVAEIGLPCIELFIWGDEVEYLQRALATGTRVRTVPQSTILHPSQPLNAVVTRSSIRGFGKVYYLVRNFGATSVRGEKVRLHPRAAVRMGRIVLRELLPMLPHQPWTTMCKMAITIHGIISAFRNDLQRRYL